MPSGRSGTRKTINQSFDSFDAFAEDFVANLSDTGAFIRCEDCPSIGETVEVAFSVVADRMYEICATVRVVRHAAEPRGIGVEFLEFKQGSQEALTSLLEKTQPA